jgi:hypothetical protein
MSKRTFEGINDSPLWTPDGDFLIFRKYFPGQSPPHIVRLRAEGGQTETLIANDKPGTMFRRRGQRTATCRRSGMSATCSSAPRPASFGPC